MNTLLLVKQPQSVPWTIPENFVCELILVKIQVEAVPVDVVKSSS